MRISPHPLRLSIGLLALLFVVSGCGSEHKVLEPGVAQDAAVSSSPDTNAGPGVDASSVPTAACPGQTGVAVAGTINFSGTAPAAARLWLFWRSPAGGIPPCSMEIKPVAFPASFRFEQVPNLGWSLDAFIDVDGGFPPISGPGDHIVEIPARQLDLSADVSGLQLEIPLTPTP